MKTEKTIKEKIKSTSGVLSVLFKIARILCFVGIVLVSAGILYVMFFGNIDLLVLNGKVLVRSPYALFDIAGVDNWQIIFTAFAALVSLILLTFLFKYARDIFKDISIASSPFEKKQVTRIRKIAVFFLVISFLDIQTTDLSVPFTMNFIGIVGGLMLWCISMIFEYGCELQKESDETL